MTQDKDNKPSPTKPARTPRAVVQMRYGRPTLTIGGRAVAPILVDLNTDTPPDQIRRCYEAGIRLFRVTSVDLGWHGGKNYNYDALDACLQNLKDVAPEASFLLAVSVDAPQWWRYAHSDECMVYAKNNLTHRRNYVSWASEVWQSEGGQALSRLVKHVLNHTSGTNCIGFQPSMGVDGSWRIPHPEDLPDVGHRMRERLLAYVQEKYRNNELLLRKGWNDPRAIFERVTCPLVQPRQYADLGILRDPAKSGQVLDFYDTFFEAQNQCALHFCKVVKTVSDNTCLVALTYATVLGDSLFAEDGHGYPEPVLDSPLVDFFVNPSLAQSGLACAPLGSLSLRGKLVFAAANSNPANFPLREIGAALPITMASEQITALVSGWEERVKPEAGQLRRVAVFADPISRRFVVEAPSENATNTKLLTAQVEEFAAKGAKYSLYLLSDLFHPQFPNADVLVFLNPLYLSEAERRRIDAKVKRSDNVAIWLWGAGLIGEEGISDFNASRLTSLRTRMESRLASQKVRITHAGHPFLKDYHAGTPFGIEATLNPVLSIGDKEAERLAINTSDKTAFAVRRFPQWTSVSLCAVHLPARILQAIVENPLPAVEPKPKATPQRRPPIRRNRIKGTEE